MIHNMLVLVEWKKIKQNSALTSLCSLQKRFYPKSVWQYRVVHTYIQMYSKVMWLYFKIHCSVIASSSETMKFEILFCIACWIHFVRFQKERSIFPKLLWISRYRNSDVFTHVGGGYIEVGLDDNVDDIWRNGWTGVVPRERVVFE